MQTELWANSGFSSPGSFLLILSDRLIFNKGKEQKVQKRVYNKRKEGKTSCHREACLPSLYFLRRVLFIFAPPWRMREGIKTTKWPVQSGAMNGASACSGD